MAKTERILYFQNPCHDFFYDSYIENLAFSVKSYALSSMVVISDWTSGSEL